MTNGSKPKPKPWNGTSGGAGHARDDKGLNPITSK